MNTDRAYYETFWGRRETAHQDPLTEERTELFLRMVPRKSKVLDLGCGNGSASQLLVAGGLTVVGLDISHDALMKGHKLDTSLCVAQATCDGPLPLASESFDAVYCTEVIEHVLDPETLIRESYRVLKPSGVLFVSAPYHGRIKNILLATAAFEEHFDVLGGHIRFFTLRSLRNLLQGNNFQVERIWRLGRFRPIWMDMAFLARKAPGDDCTRAAVAVHRSSAVKS